MTEDFIYILLGVFDALAIWACAFAPFKLPIYAYRWTLLGSSVFIALLSYVNRMVLPLSALDTPIQFVVLLLLCRYMLKIRFFWSTLALVTGYMMYMPLQFGLYFLLTASGLVPEEVMAQNTGYVFLLQIASILTAYLIALVLKATRKGFSFIQQPPHDFSVKENCFTSANEKLLIGIAVGLVCISFSVMLIHHSYQLVIFPGVLIASFTVYSVAWRRNRLIADAQETDFHMSKGRID